MQTRDAIARLKELKTEAETKGVALRRGGAATSWRGRVRTVLAQSLGLDHHLSGEFEFIKYTPIAVAIGATDEVFDRAFLRGLEKACAIIEAAIYELEIGVSSDDVVDETAFDPDLWDHVKIHVEHEEWQKVASQTAIFVEHQVRRWVGNPTDSDGKTKVGKNLFLAAFGNGSTYQLGKESGENEGWRALGTGFAQALSNVDRHNIQDRDDAKRYAFGVLGLGSLILTQLRHQHGPQLQGQ